MDQIQRFNAGARLSDVTVYNGVAYLSGQCCDDGTLDITDQTTQVLAAVDKLLARAGSDRRHVLFAQIFLVDLADFDGMNKAWEAWVSGSHAPARATVQSRLAKPEWKVEIVITAAVPG